MRSPLVALDGGAISNAPRFGGVVGKLYSTISVMALFSSAQAPTPFRYANMRLAYFLNDLFCHC